MSWKMWYNPLCLTEAVPWQAPGICSWSTLSRAVQLHSWPGRPDLSGHFYFRALFVISCVVTIVQYGGKALAVLLKSSLLAEYVGLYFFPGLLYKGLLCYFLLKRQLHCIYMDKKRLFNVKSLTLLFLQRDIWHAKKKAVLFWGDGNLFSLVKNAIWTC